MRLPHALLLAAALAAGCSDGGGEGPPDVVVVVIDTLRSDRLTCYGYDRPTSPFLDRLADEGALFTDVTAQSSWTRPSMVSLFTGRYLTDYRDTVPSDQATLAGTFQQAGYRTVGLVANVLLDEKTGFARGFDHYDARPLEAEGRTRTRTLEQLAADLWTPLEEALATDGDGERPPLFLYLHPFDPHDPYFHHPEYDGELPRLGAEAVHPPGWVADTIAELGPPAPENDPGWEIAKRRIQGERGSYDQEIRYTDRVLEQVFDRLEAEGVLENAVVAVLSDHGEGLWEHVAISPPDKLRELPPTELLYQKHGAHLYEEAIRTPFLLWGAGVPAGLDVSAPVENVDLLPTLLELTDVPAQGPLHGRSLVELFDGVPSDWRSTVHSYVLHGVTVREPATGLKLIVPFDPGGENPRGPELYDVANDPHERSDLGLERPADLQRLRTVIEEWTRAHPTRSDFGRELGAEEAAMLDDLGYTGDHTGERGPQSPPDPER